MSEIQNLSLLAMQFRNDERVLEGLEPHSNLEVLIIENFSGGKFPSWIMVESQASQILGNLMKIKLQNCNCCEQIPPLGHLRHLKVVEIIGMYNVEDIGTEFYRKHAAGSGGGGASSSTGAAKVTMFPALRELALEKMPRLEKWLEVVHRSGDSLYVFPCLEKLMIETCPSLITIPHHFQSVRELSISSQGVFTSLNNNLSCLPKNLEALRRLCLIRCNNLIDIPCLPSVREVSISGCEKLIGLPSLTQVFPVIEKLTITDCPNMTAFPDMHHHTSLRELCIVAWENLTSVPKLCTSLRSLYIDSCKSLTSFPEGLGTTLEELRICCCPAMVSFPVFRYLRKLYLYQNSEAGLDYFPWPSSTSTSSCDVAVEENDDDNQTPSFDDRIQCLEVVELKGCPEIKSLPEKIQNLSALTYLTLESFDGLEALPEWLGNLSSLQSLLICYCQNLMYMPSQEAMKCLTNLSRLEIFNSPLLTGRCIKGSRPEWEKISHITTIKIEGLQ